MSQDSHHQLISYFIQEAEDLLQIWEKHCMSLERHFNQDEFDALFRAVHSLKGSSRMVGLQQFGEVLHVVEDTIVLVRKGQRSFSSQVTALLLEAHSHILNWVENLKTNPEYVPQDYRDYINKIVAFNQPAAGEGTEGKLEQPRSIDKPPMPSVHQPAVVLHQATDIGAILIEHGIVREEEIARALKIQNRKLGEVLMEMGHVTPKQIEFALEVQKERGHKVEDTIRLSTGKIEQISKLIGELAVHNEILFRCKIEDRLESDLARSAIEVMNRSIREIQDRTLALRLFPVKSIMQRLERVVQDLARKQNKKIQVKTIGENIELESRLFEKIKDPLVHLLTNAVDHGLETTEERTQVGKPEEAIILLSVEQRANEVVIAVEDDGRGINRKKVRKKAIAKGLIQEGEKLSDADLHKLLLKPGFSTVDQVTAVSGRGVGLDVVNNVIKELGGSLTIDSVLGGGTIFTMTLPSSLAFVDAAVVQVNDAVYAVPVLEMSEIVYPNPRDIKFQDGHKLLALRDLIVPVKNMGEILDAGYVEQEITDHPAIIVSHQQGRSVGLLCDQISNLQPLMVRPLEGRLARNRCFAGTAILNDGEPAIVLDLSYITNSLLQMAG